MTRACALLFAATLALAAAPATADETCQSPFLPKLVGQEDYVYVWTLGIEGVGDGSDKLVTVGANPARPAEYGQVVDSLSMGGRFEAHHGGFDDDRSHLWLGGLDTSTIWLVDVRTDPAHPRIERRIDDFVEQSGGVVGPHGFYALPGRVLISGLSNAEDLGGRTALVEYSNAGDFIRTIWMPEGAQYGYDARVNANLNRMLTSSFTGHANYMRPIGELLADPAAMQNFGSTMVVWDYHARRPLEILDVPGAPLEVRWALGPRHDYAYTAAALTSRLWGVFRQEDGTFEAVDFGPIGDPAKSPIGTWLPVDISISSDDQFLFVDTFLDGTVRVYDISEPRAPKLAYQRQIGKQVNMVSQSWDGERLYFTSSLLANWDNSGEADEQFLKAFAWDGQELTPLFGVDFRAAGLGRPHLMRFGQAAPARETAPPADAPMPDGAAGQ